MAERSFVHLHCHTHHSLLGSNPKRQNLAKLIELHEAAAKVKVWPAP